MPYTGKKWIGRCDSRIDLTAFVTHLTRGAEIGGVQRDAVEVLIKILREREITGSTTESGFINGTNPATCFFDAPLYSLCQTVLHETSLRKESTGHHRVRYKPAGLMFDKPYVYRKGGRPVIYDRTEEAKQYLPASQWWRIVNFNLSNPKSFIDWTHERELRVKGDFQFDISKVVVVLPGPSHVTRFRELSAEDGEDVANMVGSVVPLNYVFH